jgi:hypothetical protein
LTTTLQRLRYHSIPPRTENHLNSFCTITVFYAPTFNMRPSRVVALSHSLVASDTTVERDVPQRPPRREIRPENNEVPAQQQQMTIGSDSESDYGSENEDLDILGLATIATLSMPQKSDDQNTQDAHSTVQTAPPTPPATPILASATPISSPPQTPSTQTDSATPPQPNTHVCTPSTASPVSPKSGLVSIHSQHLATFSGTDYLVEIYPLYGKRFGIPGYTPPAISEQWPTRGLLIFP